MIRSWIDRLDSLASIVILLVVLALGSLAVGYFTSTGDGTASAVVGTASPPQDVTAQQSDNNVTIDWQAPSDTSGLTLQGYRVTRSDGAYVCGSPTLTTDTTCTDVDPPTGTYVYTVIAVYNSFTSASASGSVTVTQPSVAVTASTGHVGDTVTVSGSDFPPSSAITATYDGSPLTLSPATPTTDTSGDVPGDVTFTVPASAAGSHDVEISAGNRSGDATFTVTPGISLSASSGVSDTTQTITGTGFAADSTIAGTFAGSGVTLTGGSTDATGDFSATFTVPSGQPGTDSVVATDGATNSASASFTIDTPSLSLGETSGDVSDSVELIGSDFPADSSIIATYDGQQLQLSGSADTDDAGDIPSGVMFTVPASVAGAHTVQVTVGSLSSSATFTVTPELVLTPANGSVGTTDSVSGTGFAADSTITAQFGGSSVTLGGTTQTGDDGSFSGATLTVPSAPSGAHTIEVTDGASPADSATASFTINPEISVSPADGQVGSAVSVSGSGFAAGQVVTATLGGSPVTLSGGTTTGGDGSFSGASFSVPDETAGAYMLTVDDGSGGEASASFTIDATVSGLSPTEGTVGSTASITAADFVPDSALSVKVGGARATIVAGGTTDDGGAATVTFTIPPDSGGAQTVVVTDAASDSAASGTDFTVDPSVTLTPASGVAGTTGTIAGTGFAADSTISATFAGAGVSLSGGTSDSSGSFSATYAVPDQAPGGHTVVATDGTSDSAQATYTISTPSITLGSTAGSVGDTVTISGSTFPADATISATYDGTTLPLSGTTTTDGSGDVPSDVSFAVPASTAGDHTVEVTVGAASADATFAVSPSISLSPTSGVAGTTDTIVGTGFAASSTITATFGGASAALTGGTSDGSGSFTATYTVPDQSPGAATVVATDGSSDSANASYTVDTPAIGFGDGSGPDGATVALSGSSFPASSTISATWDGVALTLGGTTTTTTAGALPSDLTFTVPASATLGDHTVEVTAGGQSASATYSVTPAFTVSASATQVAGTSFTVTITATAAGVTDTGYSGSHTIDFSGPDDSPDGTAPSYPASVSFSGGVGSATVTLPDAESTTLTASDDATPSTTGTSSTIDVGATSPAALVFHDASVTGTGSSFGCDSPATNCTATVAQGGGTWNFTIGLIDAYGNPATAGTGGVTVTASAPSLGDGTVSPSSVTIADGDSQSTQGFTYTTGTGAYGPETFSLDASPLTSAQSSVTSF